MFFLLLFSFHLFPFSFFLPEQPAGVSRADQRIIVNIPASAPWTDTGLTVSAGDRIVMRAWGNVFFGDRSRRQRAAPDGSGVQGGGCTYVVSEQSVSAHGLVANVAPQITFDGRGFFVGSTWSGSIPVAGTSAPEGRLLLGFNDSGMQCDRSGYDSWSFRVNNTGSFTVELVVTRAR
jgi:hypothetical protein